MTLLRKRYKLHYKTKFQGMNISIENRKGSYRTGIDSDGKQWKTKLHFPYGYIRRTISVGDKEHVDCFIGINKDSDKVFVIHQKDVKTGKYDEDKVMLGWETKTQAIKDYLLNYNRKDMYMGVTEMAIDEFKKKAYATAKSPKMIKAYNIEAIAKKNKLDISKFNRKELIAGIAVEREHMRDPKTKVANSISDLLKIAVAHLQEDVKYYTKLSKIENPTKKSMMIKARVKAHQRRTKTGKIAYVREHQDSRTKTSNSDPLIAEARKYKTADEFIRSKGVDTLKDIELNRKEMLADIEKLKRGIGGEFGAKVSPKMAKERIAAYESYLKIYDRYEKEANRLTEIWKKVHL